MGGGVLCEVLRTGLVDGVMLGSNKVYMLGSNKVIR